MPIKSRPDPVIPDHEILRKIGGGAYGEVWLGRGVTGAWRAVKVVWREDFEDARGFEREFEGILKFEPISRDHPGLVNILHVGRSPDGISFYYYVMELGDDLRTGPDINPIEYEPRTLRPDVKSAVVTGLNLPQCIDVGLRLAEALNHLHDLGLAHRDVKPSNVIFVNGKAKLADIGLVASRGQRTFVGTEGFVPPEGPGSTQADVYSLGKVLYEIATGKDRLDFPELPDDLPADADRKRWLELNRIICEVCEPRVSKRRITTAAELAEALRRLQGGKRRRGRVGAVWATTVLFTAFTGWAAWEMLKDSEWPGLRTKPPVEAPLALGKFRVVSTPDTAEVLDAAGKWVGTTPTGTMTAKVGEEVSFSIQKRGYRPIMVTERIGPRAVNEPQSIFKVLEVFSPPQFGDAWLDQHGDSYQPVGNEHVGFGFVVEEVWKMFMVETQRAAAGVEFLEFSQKGEVARVVLCTAEEAGIFCNWLRTNGIKEGFLTEDHEVLPRLEQAFEHPGLSERARREGLKPFRVVVRQIAYACIKITSNPPGAEVYLNGAAAGVTNGLLSISKVKPGPVELIIVLEGYTPHTEKLTIKPGQTWSRDVPLIPNQGVVFGRPWENGIGMRFVPLGHDLMVSVWETRVRDYDLFVKESKHREPSAAGFPQGPPDHPVVFVSRDDAVAFCEWLTKRERHQHVELIATSHGYRLPTDVEWSMMVGLEESLGLSPSWRDARKERVFPWGLAWPPPGKVGNFADESAALAPGMSGERVIPEYDDGFEKTAPVGSFPPNDKGLFDLSGNVHEWVSDDYSIVDPNHLGVLRGGGWNTYQAEDLYSGSRHPQLPASASDGYGFRVVLAKLLPLSDSSSSALDPPAP
ncbi:MAG: SUMF1/EgtB/PvdO family nonheme iron enzyme [Verrucomicrobia bacterium]|nr:SUMF1/EgtB/PvdO family nonheme iron enzyme [Verrucomicrobiota bacterium]